MSDLIMAL